LKTIFTARAPLLRMVGEALAVGVAVLALFEVGTFGEKQPPPETLNPVRRSALPIKLFFFVREPSFKQCPFFAIYANSSFTPWIHRN
jgi:hypothetical protein